MKVSHALSTSGVISTYVCGVAYGSRYHVYYYVYFEYYRIGGVGADQIPATPTLWFLLHCL